MDDRLIDFYASDYVSYCWKMCFYLLSNFLYSTGGATKRRRAWGNFPPTLLLDGPGCVNNALINALKKLTLWQRLLLHLLCWLWNLKCNVSAVLVHLCIFVLSDKLWWATLVFTWNLNKSHCQLLANNIHFGTCLYFSSC